MCCHSFLLEIVQVHERLGTLNSPEGIHVQNSLKDPKGCNFSLSFRLCRIAGSPKIHPSCPRKETMEALEATKSGESHGKALLICWLCIVRTTLNVTLWQGLGDTSSTCSAGKQRRVGGCPCQKLAEIPAERNMFRTSKKGQKIFLHDLISGISWIDFQPFTCRRACICKVLADSMETWRRRVRMRRFVDLPDLRFATWKAGYRRPRGEARGLMPRKRYLMTFWQFWCFSKCRTHEKRNIIFRMSTTWQRWSICFTNWFGVNCDWKCWAFLCRWLSAIPTWHAVNRLCVWPGCPWQLRLAAYLKPCIRSLHTHRGKSDFSITSFRKIFFLYDRL